MNLHIFNPEHDIALAMDKSRFAVPHVAQELRMNLGFLPALWAEDGDCVLVDDVNFALKAVKPYRKYTADVLFVDKGAFRDISFDVAKPWGWDRRIKAELLDAGMKEDALPSDEYINGVRDLSHRRLTSTVLPLISNGIEDRTCGTSFQCESLDEVREYVARYDKVVVKAPWSSSGRGVTYYDRDSDMHKTAHISRTIQRQGSVMVEPYYNRIADFAMEFVAGEDGSVEYRGLSVFQTLHGKYTGSLVASEEYKLGLLGKYVDEELLRQVSATYVQLLPSLLTGKYAGALGIDMMIVGAGDAKGFLLHPCVELNMRNTMGHVALSLAARHDGYASLMSIIHDVNYELRLSRVEGRYVNVI